MGSSEDEHCVGNMGLTQPPRWHMVLKYSRNCVSFAVWGIGYEAINMAACMDDSKDKRDIFILVSQNTEFSFKRH